MRKKSSFKHKKAAPAKKPALHGGMNNGGVHHNVRQTHAGSRSHTSPRGKTKKLQGIMI